MLRKLIKFEIKSLRGLFIPLWIACAALMPLITIAETLIGNRSNNLAIVFLIHLLFLIALNAIGIILVIQRFYNGLLKDEGYLLFPLPVEPWKLICAKGITASAIIAVNTLLFLLSLFIMDNAAHDKFFANPLFSLVFTLGPFAAIKLVFQIYASIATGHLSIRHRLASSFGAFVAIEIAMFIFDKIFKAFSPFTGSINSWVEIAFAVLKRSVDFDVAPVSTIIFFYVIPIAAFFIITARILTERLNLE